MQYMTYILFAILATMENIFIEVARKIIWEMLTAAASAFVGHLYRKREKEKDNIDIFQILKRW